MLEARKSELEGLYSDSEGFSGRARELDSQLETSRKRLDSVKGEISALEASVAVSRANIRNAESNRLAREQEAGAQRVKAEGLDGQISENDARRAGIDERLESRSKELEGLTAEIEEAGRQARDTVRRIEGLRASCALLKEQRQERLAQVMSLKAAAAELDERQEAIFWQKKDGMDRLARQKAEIEETENELEGALQAQQEAQNALSGFEMMIKLRQEKLDAARRELSSAEREWTSRGDRLNMLEGMEREYEGFSQAVRRIMRARKGLSGIHGPLSSLIRVEDIYSAAVETALGAAMQNIVVDSEEDAKAAIGYLKSNNLGRATFLPISSIRPRWQNRRALEGERGFCGYGDGLVKCDEAVYKRQGYLTTRIFLRAPSLSSTV